AKRARDGRPEIRICIDVVENPPSVVSLQIFDSTSVQFGCMHNPSCGLDRRSWHVWVGKEFHGRRRDCLPHFTRATATVRIAHWRRTQIEMPVCLDAHGIQKLSAKELEADDALLRVMR